MVQVNEAAPDFTLFDTERNQVSLSGLRGSKVVIAFYPAAFTGVCTAEMCTFRDSMEALNQANAKVLGISADSPWSNGAFSQKNQVNFPLLSDFDRATIRAYGVAFENFGGMPGYTASQRAVFIVNEEGVITYRWVGENPGVQPNYDEVLAAL